MTIRTLRRIMVHGLDLKNRQRIAQLYEHRHGHLEASVTWADVSEVWRDAIVIRGEFIVHGEACGTFERHLIECNGCVSMQHHKISLDEGFRDRGLIQWWSRECERRYSEFGIQEIDLWAIEAGGYVWAREGFSLGAGEPLPQFWESLQEKVEDLIEQGHIRASTARRWGREIGRGKISTIQQVMCLGSRKCWYDKSGRRCWPGKMLLLDSEWQAVKALS